MTDSAATLTRDVLIDLPDYPGGVVLCDLLTYFAADGTEGFPQKSYSKTLDGSGVGTQKLPVPSTGAWLYRITLPDGNMPKATLAAGSPIQLTAWLAAALSSETPNTLTDTFVLKGGDAMTGPLTFSGTDHAGINPIHLTTAERDALTPAEGMFIYNETDSKFQAYQGGAWVDYGSGGAGAVDSVFARTGDVVAATSDYDAVQVDFTPAGTIAATNVQAAIEELDSEKETAGAAATVQGNLNTHTNLETTAHGGILPEDAGIVAVASSRDIAASDAGKLLTVTATAALNCPDGISGNLQCAIASHGGTTTITATTTLQYLDGGLQTAASGVVVNTQCTLVHFGSNVWTVYGDVTPI